MSEQAIGWENLIDQNGELFVKASKVVHPIQAKILMLTGSLDLNKLSYREIGEMVGSASAQKVKHHMDSLTLKGLLYARSHR